MDKGAERAGVSTGSGMGTRLIEEIDNKPFFRAGLCIFFCSWAVRLAAAWGIGAFHNFAHTDMERIAISLAKTGVMADFMVPGLPTAGESPAYVIFLAGIYRLFGTGALGEAVKIVACTAASSLRCALTVWLVSRLNLGKAVVAATAILSIFWIGALDTELQGDWDPPYTAVCLILLTYLHSARPFMEVPLGRMFLLGCLWGLSACFNFSILSILAAFVVLEFVSSVVTAPRGFALRLVCLTAGVFLMLLPWAIRNRITLGSWVFTRDMLGYGLTLSYHTGAHWAEPVNNHPTTLLPGHADDLSLSPYPHLNPKLRPELIQLGEVAWDQRKRDEGLRWIREHPSQALILFAQHTFYFWFPPGPDFYYWMPQKVMWPYSVAKWMLTVLAFAGLYCLRNTRRRAALHLGAILLAFPLVYCLVNWSSRYRMPIEWVLVLLTGVSLGRLWTVLRHDQESP